MKLEKLIGNLSGIITASVLMFASPQNAYAKVTQVDRRLNGTIIRVNDGKAACVSCGHKIKKKLKIESSEKIKKNNSVVVIKEESDNTYPVVEIECPECGNSKAYFWTMQTRSSDESETKFYKCMKCRHTWRKYR